MSGLKELGQLGSGNSISSRISSPECRFVGIEYVHSDPAEMVDAVEGSLCSILII